MSTNLWQRPFLLAAASAALVTVTACGAQAATHGTRAATHAAPAATGHSALARQSSHCGEGGEGGKGGAPGRPGQPGQPGKPGCSAFGDLHDLPDKPTSELSQPDKARIALTVLTGRVTQADAARKYKISEKEISTWERQLLNGDWLALLQPESP
ncbi:DUF1153 domain-containing protein [Streptomyces alanosinicus]|uniref:DUF1153 domain-containing protein n=1 Tax=Streptomyces alanosinicus TaxID=68171 RepID=A0A918YIY4_9ACTN|nr:DUF1153 domain-containing protein [Streptomyces alanosinicus]GHE04805.1 hypothetical protein GCM10010339_37980 [Streptomyces alanosinicus]